MKYTSTEKDRFFIDNYSTYGDLPLDLLDQLPFAVYLIDYNWKYLFLNKHSKGIFGELADELVGKSALQVFQAPRFNSIFEKIKDGPNKRISIHAKIDSPLRGEQILLRGYPLKDCYYFSSTLLPGTHQVIEELRGELKRKADESVENTL